MKIVILSRYDFAGSGMRIRDAVRRYNPNHTINLVTYMPPRHSADYVLLEMIRTGIQDDRPMSVHDKIRNKACRLNMQRKACEPVQKLINECDIVHFKGDYPPTRNWNDLIMIPEDKKIIISVGGSGFRRSSNNKKSSMAKWPMESYMLADLRTALTPDLNYPEYKGIYTQQAIDSESVENSWQMPESNQQLTIAHSPSCLIKKGTESIFLPAVVNIQKRYDLFNVDIITKMRYEKCLERKKKAQMFFDQAGVGFYGNAALEAMQYGIPTICHISQEAVEQSDGKITKDHPVIAMRKATVKSCEYAIRKALRSDLQKLSRETKEFCDQFHSYSVVGKMWSDIYESLAKK